MMKKLFKKEAKTAQMEVEEAPKAAPSKFNKIYCITTRVLSVLATIAFLALIVNLLRLNILPIKYLIIIIVVCILLSAFNIFLAFFNKKEKILRPISIVLSIAYIAVSIFGFIKINDTINFFSYFGVDKITNTYDIIVAKDSEYNENSDLTGTTIYTYRDLTIDSELVAEATQKNFGAEAVFEDNLLTLMADGSSNNTKLISINEGTYEAFLSDNDLYKDSFRVIKTFDIITEAEEKTGVDITKDPFTIYLSGIDTRTGTLPSRSLSDVNMVITVNPTEHKVLLVSIPRDYYVHLSGTPEESFPDKLTHAGSKGGVILSKDTVEDLLGVDINYYARVNFNFVKNLVDAVDGITINSDVDYSFTCKADKNCTINPGDNFVYGDCALAFARERKAYSSGDRHRGENQEQVISVILNKVSKSSTLLSKYSDILGALEGTFETNFSMDEITSFFRFQLDDMKSWSVENQNLNGSGGSALTYSYPSQYLSVIYPDEETIDAAKAKIYEYLGIEIIEEPIPTEEAAEIEE